jgi:signal transduction histidine kinase
MEMNRVWLLKISIVLQFFANSLNASTIDLGYIQIYDTSQVNEHINLYFKLINTDTANARKCLEEALTISKETGYLNGIARSEYYLGLYYLEQFDLLKAENYFTESYEESGKSGDRTRRATNTNNLGTISEKKGDYGDAILKYLDAFELFDSLNNKIGLSATANNIGIVYYLLNEPEKARNFFRLSLDLKQQLNDTISMVYTFQNLGNVYFDLWEYDSAKYYYEKCIDLSGLVDDAVSAGKAYNSLGVIAMIKNDYKQALQFYTKALHYSKMKNDVRNITAVYDNLGILNSNSGNPRSATSYYDSSLALSKQHGLKDEMKNAYQHLSSVFALQGNYKDAFLNLLNYDDLQNNMLTEKSDVSGVEALFVKQKQENKILKLEKDQAKRETQIVLSLAIILILLVVSILGFYIYRISQKSKNSRKIAVLEKERFKAVIEAQEMERKRIAGDLHDSLGQMLSLSKLQLSEIIDSSLILTPEHEKMLVRSTQIIDEACQEVRNISHNLMPGPLIRLGLTSAVKDLVRKINSSKKIQVSFSSNLDTDRLDEKVEISVYRIIQEILNNTLKHAKASQIGISLNIQDERTLVLMIADNGIGFDTGKIIKSSGIGWKNIYSRLEIINGFMNVNSIKNQGTNIEIKVIV